MDQAVRNAQLNQNQNTLSCTSSAIRIEAADGCAEPHLTGLKTIVPNKRDRNRTNFIRLLQRVVSERIERHFAA